jgi:hypothetical protein
MATGIVTRGIEIDLGVLAQTPDPFLFTIFHPVGSELYKWMTSYTEMPEWRVILLIFDKRVTLSRDARVARALDPE